MKKINIFVVAILALLIINCKNEDNLSYIIPSMTANATITDDDPVEKYDDSYYEERQQKLYHDYQNDFVHINKFMSENAPKIEYFQFEAEEGTEKKTLITQNGTTFMIPANAFVDSDGNPIKGQVEVRIQELFSPSQMLLANRPTITEKNEMLISFGEMRVMAFQRGEELQLGKGNEIEVKIDLKKTDNAENVRDNDYKIPIWLGDTTITVSQWGVNCNAENVVYSWQVNQPNFKWVKSLTPPAVVNTNSTNNTSQLSFTMPSVGRWYNPDVIRSATGTNITVTGVFLNNFNPATNANYQRQQPSALFFKPKGSKTLIGLYCTLINAPNVGSCGNGFYSYIDSMPENTEGSFLAISCVNGQFYSELKTGVMIKHNYLNSSNQKIMKMEFDPQPISEVDLLDTIRQLDIL